MMAMNRQEIAEAITMLRVKHKMKRSTLAKAIGSTSTSLWQWETGAVLPGVEKLFAICEYFGVSVDETFNIKTPIKPMRDNVNRGFANRVQQRTVNGSFLPPRPPLLGERV